MAAGGGVAASLVAKFRADTRDLEVGAAKAEGIVKKTAGGMDSKLAGVGQSMKSVGRTMTLGMTMPIVGLGVASFKAFGDFDQTIRQVGATTGDTGKDLKVMSDLALKMGADTSFSAGQAADAMLELSKGGMTSAQIKAGVLSDTLTLAAAGGLELGAAATYMSNTMNTFGLKAGDAGAIAAALAGGANASTASVESLGRALSQVGPGAKIAGMTMNETVAALAAFDNAGVKGSDAGTSLKTMLTNLNPHSAKARDLMKELGIEFTNSNGSFKDMSQVAQELQDGLKGLSESQKVAALNTLFGSDAARAGGIMAAQGAKGIEKMIAATNDMGAAQKMAKTNTEGAKGGIEQMMGSIETLGIQLGSIMAPVVTDVVKKITQLANKFMALSPKTQKISLLIAGVAAAMGPVLVVAGTLATAISAIGGVLGAVSLPVIAVVAAIGLLGYGLYKAYKESETFRDTVNQAISEVKEVAVPMVKEMVETIRFQINLLKKFWDKHGADIKKIIIPIMKFVVKNVTAGMKNIMNLVRAVMALMRGDWREAWDRIKDILSTTWGRMKEIVSNAGPGLKRILVAIGKGFIEAGTYPFRKVLEFVAGFVTQVGTKLGQVAGKITAAGTAMYNAGGKLWGKLASGFQNAFGNGMDFVSDMSTSFANIVIGLLNSAIPNSLPIPGPAPDIDLPNDPIPTFASGGITRGRYTAGESGMEAIIPLSSTRRDQARNVMAAAGLGASVSIGNLTIVANDSAGGREAAKALLRTLEKSGLSVNLSGSKIRI